MPAINKLGSCSFAAKELIKQGSCHQGSGSWVLSATVATDADAILNLNTFADEVSRHACCKIKVPAQQCMCCQSKTYPYTCSDGIRIMASLDSLFARSVLYMVMLYYCRTCAMQGALIAQLQDVDQLIRLFGKGACSYAGRYWHCIIVSPFCQLLTCDDSVKLFAQVSTAVQHLQSLKSFVCKESILLHGPALYWVAPVGSS